MFFISLVLPRGLYSHHVSFGCFESVDHEDCVWTMKKTVCCTIKQMKTCFSCVSHDTMGITIVFGECLFSRMSIASAWILVLFFDASSLSWSWNALLLLCIVSEGCKCLIIIQIIIERKLMSMLWRTCCCVQECLSNVPNIQV